MVDSRSNPGVFAVPCTGIEPVKAPSPEGCPDRLTATWILNELATVNRELASYARKYGVSSPEAIEEGICRGVINGHPAWEDSIDWSNLIVYREKILAAAAMIDAL